ncbi:MULTISPECIES: type 1 glutamine amidotransferase family protein [Asticcacaulis]|uniref:type 1 glutamine amidotransferase family protein n=1 Tax=Asticcacaulis TaxID=76890 RepID=UPI001AE9EDB1|nr:MULTISPECIES: type 1 glutamine amidotransferase family protein [Asticcacaulis]MBP2159656.1 putative intracellular protease/amidase [Asticcacaulis solisilvae]MDR6800517.1 putative intracellular protease/amidase [Asticcacaulis sp. BE141]
MTETVYLYVFDTLADWEPGYAIANINDPTYQKSPGRYTVTTVGVTRDPVTTTGGMRILPDFALSDIDPSACAMLILPGGARWDERGNGEGVDLAKAVLAVGGKVAAICGATAGLARGGVLDNRKHTSNAADYIKATGYGGAHLYVDAQAYSDGTVITAPGTAPVDFAREIFRALDLFDEKVLDAWYKVFKTGDASHFAALEEETA